MRPSAAIANTLRRKQHPQLEYACGAAMQMALIFGYKRFAVGYYVLRHTRLFFSVNEPTS
jgi:hypothetical protein